MDLNEEQMAVVERIENGGNFFITGKSGAGKTTIIKALQEGLNNAIFCAPTAAAARLIQGQTIHRMFQIPPYPYVDVKKLPPLGILKRRLLKNVTTVVIDEVSMLRSDVLSAVDFRLRQCARTFDETQKPFAGRNLVLVGDFFQLSPVVSGIASGALDLESLHEENGQYAFQSTAWKEAEIRPIYLKQTLRQRDPEFLKILSAIRVNDEEEITACLDMLNTRVIEHAPDNAVYLCTTKKIASARNASRFSELDGESKIFTGKVIGHFNPQEYPNELEIHLKTGQRVISTANSKDVCNGDTGTITGFTTDGVVVEFDTGMTAEILPVETPQFSCKIDKDEDGNNKIIVYKTGSFFQIPLISGYAITIHRSQGMTLPCVVLDIGAGCFASGQLYVAISRVRTLDSLYLKQTISADDIFIDSQIVEEEMYWKVDNRLIHYTLFNELNKLDEYQLETISFDKDAITRFLQLFINNYIDLYESDNSNIDGELPSDRYLIFIEEKIYQYSCNVYLNRSFDMGDAAITLRDIIQRFYPIKDNSSETK